MEHDAPIEIWRDAFSRIWDDGLRYRRYASAALAHSNRLDIQPDTIVNKFIDEISAFVSLGPLYIHAQRSRSRHLSIQ